MTMGTLLGGLAVLAALYLLLTCSGVLGGRW